MPKSIKTLCLYCGASKGNSPIYTDAAIQIGERIAQRGNTLVYGAGNVGLMGVAADAALNNHGEVIGVIPESLMEWEVAHTGITRLEIVSTMHERKMRMFDISDGFIAMPGGFGTMDEMFEMLTWRQIGIADKPCAFWNVNGYWSPLRVMLDKMVEQGFVLQSQRDDLYFGDSLDDMLDWMDAYEPAPVSKRDAVKR